jgi:hypothetical protein
MGADEKVAHSEPTSFPLHLDTPEEGLTLEERFIGRSIDIEKMMSRLISAL